MSLGQNFGKKRKTDLITTLDKNIVLHLDEENVLIACSYKDFMKFVKKVQRRHKQFKGQIHFNHFSPDVSIMMAKKNE